MVSQKKTKAKPQGKAKPQAKDSLVKLRAHVDGIAKRLERANGLTRASIKALSTSYETLNAGQDKQGSSADAKAQIEALSNHLTGLLEQTRKDVVHDLQMVMSDPRMETIGAALTKANQRLTQAEAKQAQAINDINDHIATLSKSLSERVEAVEQISADAMNLIGDKVVQVSEDLKKQSDDLKRDVSEQSLSQRQDFEEQKADMARRMETLEDEQRNSIPSIERRMVTMATRLEVLETNAATGLAEVPAIAPSMPSLDAAPAYNEPESVQDMAPQLDAFSASAPVLLQAVAPPQNPYEIKAQDALPLVANADNLQSDIPQDYTPTEYVADAPAPTSYAPREQSHARFNVQTGAFEQPAHNYTAPPPPFSGSIAPMEPLNSASVTRESGVMGMPPMVETMGAARPGADPNAKNTSKKSLFAKLKPSDDGPRSPVKTALLMSGIAVLGVFAAKTLLPKFMGPTSPVPQTNQQALPKPLASLSKQDVVQKQGVIQTVDTVGDYTSAMKAPVLASNGQKITLETAAVKGEPIAQFQLGLSHLEGGRNAEAVRLIRLAASQGQAAAQYRLGKLYESGIGVDANMETALQLLTQAAAGGNRIAMHDIGHYRATGAAGGEADIEAAVSWFKKAADRGVLDSQYNLGVLYQGESGVDANLSEAYIWFAIAGAQGDQVALQHKASVESELSKEDLTRAQARIKAFTPKRIDDAANGVFRNMPWSRAVKARMSTGTSVKQAQQLLANLGYDIGKADGAMGPRTRNAVIRFERANGLPETGRVNAALMERLSLAAGV